jgi:cell division protein ZapE
LTSDAAKSVSARLAAAVAGHRLEFDADQTRAAERLDALAADLRAVSGGRPARGTPARGPPTPGFLDKLRSRVSWFPRGAESAASRGLYLWGGVGRGKTLLMDAFHASLGTVRSEREHFYRFMRAVHAELAAIKRRADPLDLVAARIARRARVLCLDEFFVSDIADAMILAGLLQGLFHRGVVLVATSNTAPRDLYKEGLQRQRFVPAIELIEAHAEVLHLDGGIDYRLRQLERAPTYLDSNAPATAAALEQRFAALAGGDVAHDVTLQIEGRPLPARAVGADIAWFDFRALCAGPRSQNDYIDLARLYGTLFITDVPQFTPADDDAARRFIMLIDELYDRGVKIVVSAAALPAQLYRGERLQFEFERAASRLVEMQTQHYLAASHRG